jgi:CBS domain-containing protein
MGYRDVYDYVDGKLDWMAAGLPTEGANSQHPRAGDAARKNVPTCGLDERVGDVRERARDAGFEAAVVVNEERVVLGLLRSKELSSEADLSIEGAMRPGAEHVQALCLHHRDGAPHGRAPTGEFADHDVGRAPGRAPLSRRRGATGRRNG